MVVPEHITYNYVYATFYPSHNNQKNKNPTQNPKSKTKQQNTNNELTQQTNKPTNNDKQQTTQQTNNKQHNTTRYTNITSIASMRHILRSTTHSYLHHSIINHTRIDSSNTFSHFPKSTNINTNNTNTSSELQRQR